MKWADVELVRTGTDAATERGFPDLRAYVLRGLAAGRSLAALSSAIGLPRSWLVEHVDVVIDEQTWARQLRIDPALREATARGTLSASVKERSRPGRESRARPTWRIV